MPELPEVEVVRRGLQARVVGQTITSVRVHHPRAVRRHEAGPADLTARLLGARLTGTGRRGKYLWLLLGTEPPGAESDTALVVHLGMSGQMLLGAVPRADHVRISALLDDGTALSFVDQRTFGGWLLADLVDVDGSVVPAPSPTWPATPLTRGSTPAPSSLCCGASIPSSSGSSLISKWCRGSATSTPTRRCGGHR